jgi:hypothetical protein
MIELPERLQNKISPEPNSGCWLWTGCLDVGGYGCVRIAYKTRKVHRVVYEFYKGPISEGKELDHLCRVRCCCNPNHLEPVTRALNVWRGNSGIQNSLKTHCKWGHEFSDENTRYGLSRPGVHERICVTCVKQYEARRRGKLHW